MNINKSHLYHHIQEIVADRIHIRKCATNLNPEQWKVLDSKEIAEEIMTKLIEILELYLYIPCCHVSGTHNPTHYEERGYICNSQLAEAFKRFCVDLGVNPTVHMKPNCSWCEHYPENRNGEGLKLFQEEGELVR